MPVEPEPRREIFDLSRARTVQPLPHGVQPGARVFVRGRLWRLDTCNPHDDCDELRLEPVDEPGTLVVLWPFDRPIAERQPHRVRAVRLRQWLRVVRAELAEDRPAVHLRGYGGDRAILPYQLVPALAAAAGARRVLLADEVGLGKTAQAGWIVADTLARQSDARVLIAVPAAVRLQWVQELSRLFAIDATSVDAGWLLRAASALPPGVNVWTPPGVYVVSLDFLKRPAIAASARAVIWDLLVVDEAHVAAAPTERFRAVDSIARRSRTIVLITATPFSGDEASFASLTAVGAAGGSSAPLMFRRSRADVGDVRRRRHRFVRVRFTAVEQRLQRLLDRYCREVWRHAPSAEGRLAAIVLRKRALSSPAALARSLRRRQSLLSTTNAPIQLALFRDDVDDEDEEPSAVLGSPGLPDAARERAWLRRLIDAAGQAGAANSKLDYLKRLLRRIPGESAIVFTEFRDTLSDLAGAFPASLCIHGGMTPGERHDVQARFNAAGGLLFATDAAANGLNLHRRCRIAINFELPWNPARLEQRIGRVDRIGQSRVVHAATLVARDTAEDVVIANIARRLLRVAGSLGAGDRLAAFLNDARVAGMVIGGEPVPPMDAPRTAASEQIPSAAIAEALRLSTESASPSTARVLRIRRSDIAVASTRASNALPSGFVVIVQWTLHEPSGRLVACRTVAMHIDGEPARPARAADAGKIASIFLAGHGPLLRERTLAELRPDRTASQLAHDRAVESRIGREVGIHGDVAPLQPFQPGLFDGRATRDAMAAGDADDELRAESMQRIHLLRTSCGLEEDAAIRAVLIVWKPTT